MPHSKPLRCTLFAGKSNLSSGKEKEESSNIVIGNNGTAGDNNVIRIGTQGTGSAQQSTCYIAGIEGVNVGSIATVVSIATATGQLGSTTITAGSNITVTGAANTITIAASSGSIPWTTETSSASMAVNNGYISNSASLITLTLPTTAAVGSLFYVTGQGAGGWKIAQNASQSINFGSSTTTVGTGGSLASTLTYDSVTIVCIVANTTFNVIASIGNITVV